MSSKVQIGVKQLSMGFFSILAIECYNSSIEVNNVQVPSGHDNGWINRFCEKVKV